jgi:glutathione synthase/RimK-type ligase-like ATP-grasp enzyme
MNTPLATIGRTERVSLPKLGLYDIPAKIDTGADSSSIWASGIVEHNGMLTFVLFDTMSHYYNGERISTNEYTVVTVKNSFGVSEQRYKVKLTMRLGGKLIRAWFNLANRERNRYPVLIGNSSIRNKFLIDVSTQRSAIRGQKARILMLASAANSPLAQKLVDALKRQYGSDTDFVYSSYPHLKFQILNGKVRVTELTSGRDLSAFDVVYFRTYFAYAEIAAAAAEYLAARHVLFLDREVATYHALSKLTQYVKLALAGLPVPDSIFTSSGHLHFDELSTRLGVPFVLKDVFAEKGRDNHLVYRQAELDALLESKPRGNFIAQKFIPNDGDMRVLVFDKKAELIIGRKATGDTHLNKTSTGGKAELLPGTSLDAPTTAMTIRAAAVTNRQVAGVDIIFDTKAKKWYILEVNNSPQISSGTFVDEKIAAFGRFLKRYSKK